MRLGHEKSEIMELLRGLKSRLCAVSEYIALWRMALSGDLGRCHSSLLLESLSRGHKRLQGCAFKLKYAQYC